MQLTKEEREFRDYMCGNTSLNLDNLTIEDWKRLYNIYLVILGAILSDRS